MCVYTLYVQVHKGQDICEEVLIPQGKNKGKQESLGHSVRCVSSVFCLPVLSPERESTEVSPGSRRSEVASFLKSLLLAR